MIINLYFLQISITLHNPIKEKEAYLKGKQDRELYLNSCNYKDSNLINKWLEGWQNDKSISLFQPYVKNKQVKYKV